MLTDREREEAHKAALYSTALETERERIFERWER